jgi:hypothetical protein
MLRVTPNSSAKITEVKKSSQNLDSGENAFISIPPYSPKICRLRRCRPRRFRLKILPVILPVVIPPSPLMFPPAPPTSPVSPDSSTKNAFSSLEIDGDM